MHPLEALRVLWYNPTMNRTEALERLRAFTKALKERGATSLYLFGSTSRDDANAKSDLDLFLDYDPRSTFSAFDLIAAKRMLQEGLSVDVDLTTRNGLHPLIRKKVEAEATQVF
jgi:predicted nucleotidyltransferase